MDRRRNKKQVLHALFPLLLAGCAALTPESTQTAATAAGAAKASASPTGRGGEPREYSDIWNRIRAGYAMPRLEGRAVALHEQWFANNPEYMARMMERARMYLYYIVDEIEKRGLPTELALLPAIESAYQPYAASRARAVGLWQFIAPTGRLYGLKNNWWYDGRRDIQASTLAALDYLEKLAADFNGDWHLALAAYNAGEGRITRALEYNRRKGLPADYQNLKVKRETRNYVPKLMAMANIVADPERYGVQLAQIPNEPFFASVDTGSQIDLGVVARLTELDIGDLQSINPGFNRWATDPEGPHHLLIPVAKKDAFVAGLNNLPEAERVQWRGHEVRRGDTLLEIARRYGVTVDSIRTSNNLRGNMLRAGQGLIIPVSHRTLTPAVRRAPEPAPQASGKPGAVIHYVRAGDTLSGIARRYNVLINQLMQWNLIEPGDVLRLGQKLRIWPTIASLQVRGSSYEVRAQ